MSRVLAVGDLHCPGMLDEYPYFLKEIYEQWDCDTVVFIGDVIDWHAINFHGKHSETPGVADEINETRLQIDVLKDFFPVATWLIGNHDALPKRRADESGLPSNILKSEQTFWEVDWEVIPRFGHILVDGVRYSHGETGAGGAEAALKQAISCGRSTVIGHHHQAAGVRWGANEERRFFGLSTGSGLDWKRLQFQYGRKFANKPPIGCGVVLDGEYAYWEPMML